MKIIKYLIVILGTFLLASPAFAIVASDLTYTGMDCMMTGVNEFGVALNWDLIQVPNAIADKLIFNAPIQAGACSGNPVDTAVGHTDYRGVQISAPFDANFVWDYAPSTFTSYGGLTNCDSALGSDGLDIDTMNPLLGLSANVGSSKTICIDGDMLFRSGLHDINSLGIKYKTLANIITISPTWEFLQDGMYHGTSATGAGIYLENPAGTIYVQSNDAFDMEYQGVDPATNSMEWAIPGSDSHAINIGLNQHLEIQNLNATWETSLGMTNDEITITSGELTLDNALLANSPSSTDSFDVLNTDGIITLTDSYFETKDFDNAGTLNSVNSTIYNTRNIDDSSGTTNITGGEVWMDTSDPDPYLLMTTWQGNLGSTYDMDELHVTGANTAMLYGSFPDIPNTEIIIHQGSIQTGGVNQIGSIYAQGDVGTPVYWYVVSENVSVDDVRLDADLTHSITGNITINNPINATTSSATLKGTVNGEYKYSGFNYTNSNVPTMTATTFELTAGTSPHTVRNLVSPANNSILIAGNHTFEWSEEWGDVEGYTCELDEVGDSFASPDLTWNTTGKSSTSTVQDLSSLADDTYYEWRCKTYADDENGAQQTSGWSPTNQLFLLYHFQNTCVNNTLAIDYMTPDTIPAGDTPINRSRNSKLNVPLDFAFFGADQVACTISYDDDFFNVTDSISLTSTSVSTTVLNVNENTFDVGLEGREFTVECIITNTTTADTCSNSFDFAVRQSASGGVTNPDYSREANSIAYTGALFVILGCLFFFLASRNRKQQLVVEQDEDYT